MEWGDSKSPLGLLGFYCYSLSLYYEQSLTCSSMSIEFWIFNLVVKFLLRFSFCCAWMKTEENAYGADGYHFVPRETCQGLGRSASPSWSRFVFCGCKALSISCSFSAHLLVSAQGIGTSIYCICNPNNNVLVAKLFCTNFAFEVLACVCILVSVPFIVFFRFLFYSQIDKDVPLMSPKKLDYGLDK